MSDLQEKKEGLQLLAALSDDNTKAVFVRSFESHLTELVQRLLTPGLDEHYASQLRAEAIGVIMVLDRIGTQMSHASEAAIRRATQRRVLQAVGEDVG